ncbi:hypothetical protein TNCV_4768991 [Trichonephila clavipes]|nr:hypothetical protein TNCV_4768991 [Trichonephila clavipes]
MPKSNAQRGKEFRERKKKRKTSSKSGRKSDKKQKSSANLSGDFNVNFASEAKLLIEFLKWTLTINTDAREGTARHGATIDTDFSRFLDRLQSSIFISPLLQLPQT